MSIAQPPERPDIQEIDDGPDPWEIRNGIHYPSSDGESMGESGWHFAALATLYGMLRERYRLGGACVAADMMFYYEEGNPKAVRSPDLMVILGVSNQLRHSWMSWEEGAMPSVVFEFISKKTRREDLGPKRRTYEALGIPEYFLFDPMGTILRTDRFRGWRLQGEQYAPIEPVQDGLMSRELGLLIYPEEEILRLVDPVTMRTVKTNEENTDLYQRAKGRFTYLKREYRRRLHREALAARESNRLAQEERRRYLEQARLAEEQTRLAEEQTRLAEEQTRLAEEQTRLAEEQTRLAETERLRADRLSAELEQLRARLAGDPPSEA